jgi:hypothetical protein
MIFPVSGYVHTATNPLVGYAYETRQGYPDWFSVSPTGVLHKIHTEFGLSLDKLAYFVSNLSYGYIPGNGNLYEPREAHIIPGFSGPFTSNSQQVQEATTYVDFLLSTTPVYYSLPEGVLFRNLTTTFNKYSSFTGNIVEDKEYYYSETLTESYRFASLNQITTPVSGYVISPSVSRPIGINYSEGSTTGHVISLRNHWDSQALLVGLFRRSGENNITLSNKINAALVRTNKFYQDIQKSICTEFGLVKTFTLAPGEDVIVSGSIFTTVNPAEWGTYSLTPTRNEYWEGVSLPKKVYSFTKIKGKNYGISNGSVVTDSPVSIEYIYNNWSINGNSLYVSSDYSESIKFVECYGIYLNTLISLKSRLISYTGMTTFGYNVLNELSKIHNLYGTGSWGRINSTEIISETFPINFQD